MMEDGSGLLAIILAGILSDLKSRIFLASFESKLCSHAVLFAISIRYLSV